MTAHTGAQYSLGVPLKAIPDRDLLSAIASLRARNDAARGTGPEWVRLALLEAEHQRRLAEHDSAVRAVAHQPRRVTSVAYH